MDEAYTDRRRPCRTPAAFPDRQSRAWVPFVVRPASGNYLSMFNAIARLKPGVTAAQAAAEGTGRGRFAPDTGMTTTAIFGGAGPIAISAEPLRAALTPTSVSRSSSS